MCYRGEVLTLVQDSTAMFPDAPTIRGRLHMYELASAVEKGKRSIVFFMVQRNDAVCFMPNDNTDPLFGKALRDAVMKGVEELYNPCEQGRNSHIRIPVVL